MVSSRARPWLIGAVLCTAALAIALWVLTGDTDPEDPTKQGPKRWLELRRVELQGDRLRVEGTTNLVEGSLVEISVGAPGHQVRNEATVTGGKWALDRELAAIDSGAHAVTVRFQLERQSPEVQRALAFQPRALAAEGQLVVDQASRPLSEGQQASFRELFDAVNRAPRDPKEIDELDQRLLAFSGQAGLTRYREAARSLRLALEVARKQEFSRDEFERHLLAAHVRAGL